MIVLACLGRSSRFSPKPQQCSRPIRQALAPMVLAFLLAPHRRCLKTIAGEVLSNCCHVATISRRLINPQWRTRDWYVGLYDNLLDDVNAWERRQAKGKRRQWIVANRVLARTPEQDAAWLSGEKVVAWTRHWSRQQFALLELAVDNEDHVFACRRHADNLRVKKTKRRYVVAARQATVSKLGDCLIVASYKENPKVQLLPGQSAEWWDYHRAPISYRREDGRTPSRWHRKVLACTDPTATARQVVEWYEVRWQVELFFRELKSRMQFECYVLMKFEAVERYLDLLLMGLLLLEQQRLRDMQRRGAKIGAVWVQARTTDRLRMLEILTQRWNVQWIEHRLRTAGGRRRADAGDARRAAWAVGQARREHSVSGNYLEAGLQPQYRDLLNM